MRVCKYYDKYRNIYNYMQIGLKTKKCGYLINMSNSYLKIKICGYRGNMMLNKLKHKQKGILC